MTQHPVNDTCMRTADAARDANAWVEVDARRFEQNLARVRAQVAQRTRICVVMKADAYGAGISMLMSAIIEARIPCVGVTSNREARQARDCGFTGQLLRLRGATIDEMVAAMDCGVEEMLGNLDTARQLAERARNGKRIVNFHLALNAGEMAHNALTVNDELGRRQALEILALGGLRPVGIMTHFASTDVAQVHAGLAQFERDALDLVVRAGLERNDITLHAANSWLTLHVPHSHLDMVRPGRALYGFSPHDDFHKVVSFKTRVAGINAYPAGSGVSYGHRGVLQRDSRLAYVPVGYSDGYRRIFGNRGQVLIRGHRAPIVGAVTMNGFAVDVTDCPDAQIGDEVVLFGRQGPDEITESEAQGLMNDIVVDMSTAWSRLHSTVAAQH